MRRSDRLFDIIQRLRTARGPTTAAALAAALEVAPRTIYRDIAALQARHVPIEGAAGLGYVLRRGYDLPPLMFTADELDALAIGAELLRRTGDAGLAAAARSALSKVAVVSPEGAGPETGAFFVSGFGVQPSSVADLAAIRHALKRRRKIAITYRDDAGRCTRRTIWPLAIAYYVRSTIVAGWCEARQDFRHFRTDRITSLTMLEMQFEDPRGALTERWRRLPRFAEREASPSSAGEPDRIGP